ncbi:MAG: bifunctional transaldolase/phosoglucose isomerase [Chloroflexota bacterium]|nr:bifunctional transaldolase/phosoglucose isomerase [Chloroflexota bacterium]
MNTAVKLNLLGQSIWYDNIRRALIEDGTLMDLIERREIYGVTSNPSIFNKAISASDDYDADLQTMAWAGLSARDIFYKLAIKDVQDTADLFQPLYVATNGADGFVSLEVNPNLAHETEETVAEALWLWQEVDRPNLMVKIPATKEGLPAITQAIAAGVNVNVTLIFSRERYRQVMEAYLQGIEKRLAAGLDVDGIASVASFFVSRLETKADDRLQAIVDAGGEKAEKAEALLGRMALANTKLAYLDYEKVFTSERYEKLSVQGAQIQRPLWASTSTKNPNYSDIKYVESLVAENTVNTVPPETLTAYLDHGDPKITIYDDLDLAEEALQQFAELGLSIDNVTQELEDEGVAKFAESFEKLMDVIETRRKSYLEGLGDLAEAVAEKVADFDEKETIARLFRFDPTIWTNDPAGKNEIQKRLGWLALPTKNQTLIPRLTRFAEQAQEDGFEKVLLLGMGGSSLAPETISLILGDYLEGLDLRILDSTIPAQVAALEEWVDYGKTLFVVASKSGTTTETLSCLQYFWVRAGEEIGEDRAQSFIAISDPGSNLAKLGKAEGFRGVFTTNPNIGGRYSALTQFGLAPAALMGVDLAQFLWEADAMAERCSPAQDTVTNPGAVLGIILGVAAQKGQDKLTFITDESVAPLGVWLEQLVAESSGKKGKGIVPVADEPLIDPAEYGDDRIFVYLRMNGEYDEFLAGVLQAGHPALTLQVPYLYDLAGEFFRWEFAIAIACSILGVNAFDQPDVQDNKDRTKRKIKDYLKSGTMAEQEPIWDVGDVSVFGADFDELAGCESVRDVVDAFIAQAKDGDYIAINAYLPRNETVEQKLTALRERILKATGNATTLGFGPRFLHSTGQLHKGGANNGLFLQITQEDEKDLAIPRMGYSFSVLARAQAQGDLEALLARDRRAIRIHLPAGDELLF